MAIPSQLYLRAEAAELLHVSQDTVKRLVASGRLVETWVSDRSPRITAESIEAHIAANTVSKVS